MNDLALYEFAITYKCCCVVCTEIRKRAVSYWRSEAILAKASNKLTEHEKAVLEIKSNLEKTNDNSEKP